MRALGDIFLIKRGGEAEKGAIAGAGLVSLVDMVLGRLASGELGSEGGWCEVVGAGGGVVDIMGLWKRVKVGEKAEEQESDASTRS